MPLLFLCMIEILHDLICGMTTHAVMSFVENKKRDLVHPHEAMDQRIQEYLMSADDNVDISQGIIPHALLAPPVDPIVTG